MENKKMQLFLAPILFVGCYVFLCVNSQPTFLSGMLTHKGTETDERDSSDSWLVSKKYLKSSSSSIERILGNRDSSWNIVRRTDCQICRTFLTRDYFDFMVEYLPTTFNWMPPGRKEIIKILSTRIGRKIEKLKQAQGRRETDHKAAKTVAWIPYNSEPQRDLRNGTLGELPTLMFQASFWSTRRYFPNIVISVGNSTDENIIKSMNLPVYDIIVTNQKARHQQRKAALEELNNRLYNVVEELDDNPPTKKEIKPSSPVGPNKPLSQFDYVFHTEGNQLLYVRNISQIYQTIENTQGWGSVIPHRMISLLLTQSFDPVLHQKWPFDHLQTIEQNNLVTMNVLAARGSCCDDGRVNTTVNPWYRRSTLAFNHSASLWLRFGKSGFTLPTISEHEGKCSYSKKRRTCPLPPGCEQGNRIPISAKDPICGFIPDVLTFEEGEIKFVTLAGIVPP